MYPTRLEKLIYRVFQSRYEDTKYIDLTIFINIHFFYLQYFARFDFY